MKIEKPPVTVEAILRTHKERGDEIRQRLAEFTAIGCEGSNLKLWEEMVYCFFTGGCSAKMGLRSVDAVRPHLLDGDHETIMNALVGKHRYPRARARYVVESRKFLEENFGMELRIALERFENSDERREWLVKEKGIKGLGYKEASHYLRNIGYKGYAILDKHVLNSLAELKIIDDPKPPGSSKRYHRIEELFKKFSNDLKIDFDEMDLVLWSMKTGEILK